MKALPTASEQLSKIALSNQFSQDYVPPKFHYRVSSIPYCIRKPILRRSPDWVDLSMVEKQPDQWQAAHIGTMMHQALQGDISGSKHVVAIEPEIDLIFDVEIDDKKLDIHLVGHIDILSHIDNKLKVIDIKALKSSGLNYTPKQEHFLQLAVYQVAMQCDGELWYMARDTGEEMFYEQDLATAQSLMAMTIIPKVSIMAQAELREELPPIPLQHASKQGQFWECRYCEFSSFCFE